MINFFRKLWSDAQKGVQKDFQEAYIEAQSAELSRLLLQLSHKLESEGITLEELVKRTLKEYKDHENEDRQRIP